MATNKRPRKAYKRIGFEDRKKIEALNAQGKTVDEMAMAIGVHSATMYRELARGGEPYKAQVDINGLDELAEWRALDKQTALIDTDAFVTELTKDKELEDGEYRIRVPEFNHFCSTKGVSARYARKHLYESGMLRSSTDNGKINYTCPVQATDTKKTERCVCIIPKN